VKDKSIGESPCRNEQKKEADGICQKSRCQQAQSGGKYRDNVQEWFSGGEGLIGAREIRNYVTETISDDGKLLA